MKLFAKKDSQNFSLSLKTAHCDAGHGQQVIFSILPFYNATRCMYLFCIELCDSFFVYLHCLFVDFHRAKNTDLIVGSLRYSYIFLSGCIQPEQSSLIRYRSLRGLNPEQNKSERSRTVKETLVKALA